tara:strand:- start:9401 stop:9622 length:222 start_codon:yes stop_codon:yes gene_type:complete
MASKAEKAKAKAPSNVETLPSHHIQGYEAAAEMFKTELWNLAIDTMGEDFPLDWMVGILESIKQDLILLDYEE